MREKRIAVLVSGGGSNLQALLDAQTSGSLKNGRIVAVISSKAGAFALERAKKSGIPAYLFARGDYPGNAEMTRAITAQLQAMDIDLVVLAGFLHILTAEIVAAYPNAILNIHPALIPAFCGTGYYGLHVHEKVLEYGAKITGATVHFVSEEPDGGPIILQKAVEVRPEDTPETLQRRVMEQAEWVLLPKAVALFCDEKLVVTGRKVRVENEE